MIHKKLNKIIMRKIFTLLLFICLAYGLQANQQKKITKDEAWKIILNDVLESDTSYTEVYVSKFVISSNDTINTMLSYDISPDFDSWFFFIDENPSQNWNHQCKYIYLNINNGFYIEKEMICPPDLDKMDCLIRYSPTDSGVKHDKIISKSSALISPTIHNVFTSHNYAVIISGGCNLQNNYYRYWNDCAEIYTVLRNVYMYPSENIYVLMSDGTDPGYDRCLIGAYDSSPLDLDGDGTPDIQYSATKANISAVFDELSEIITEDDNLFIFTTDHGGLDVNSNRAYMNLWNNSKIYDDEFAYEVNKINARQINIVMGQCYSGGFIDNFTASNHIIVTASRFDESSYATQSSQYDEFLHLFTSAMRGINSADLDEDGYISMKEAFVYAKNNDSRNEHPQASISINNNGNNCYLTHVPKIIGSQIVCDSVFYHVDGLISGMSVNWTIKAIT